MKVKVKVMLLRRCKYRKIYRKNAGVNRKRKLVKKTTNVFNSKIERNTKLVLKK
jgi:hypothetical protein